MIEAIFSNINNVSKRKRQRSRTPLSSFSLPAFRPILPLRSEKNYQLPARLCRFALRRTLNFQLSTLLLLFFLASCSTTKNLPEGEVLYTGVKEITYNWAQPSASTPASTPSTPASSPASASTSSTPEASSTPDTSSTPASTPDAAVLGGFSAEYSPSASEPSPSPAIPDSTLADLKAEVNAALECAPNNAIFGSSSLRWPLPVGLWAYNRYINSEKRFGKWMFSTFAATPVTLTSANPTMRTQVARQVMRANGFFQGYATSTIIPNPKNDRKARISYSVTPGPLYRLDSIAYERFGPATDSIIRATMPQTLIHRNDPFSASKLDEERKRLSKRFRNNGFFYYKPEYITYLADTIQRPGYVQLKMQPSANVPPQAQNRFYIGRTTITVLPYDDFVVTDSTTNPNRTPSSRRRSFVSRLALTAADSLRLLRRRDAFVMRWGGGEKSPLRMGAIRQNLIYEPGQLYREGLHEFAQNLLAGMGIFSNIQMNYVPRDTMPDCDTLDVNIFAMLDKPYDSELEARFTNKSIGLIGPGLSWGMSKRNAFRGAESLSFKIFGSYEWQLSSSNREVIIGNESSVLNSFELGTSLSLTYPRLMPRFLQRLAFRKQGRQIAAGKTPRRTFATTTFKVDADWINRAAYLKVVNFGGEITYTFQRKPWMRHEFTPFRLEYKKMLQFTERFAVLAVLNPTMMVAAEDVIVPSIGYSCTYTPRAKGRHSRAIAFTIKEAGGLTNCIYGLAGDDMKTPEKHLLGVPFAEFLKVTAEWHETWPVSPRTDLAARVFLGAMWSYGNSTMGPFAEHFYCGGANSVRGFAVRSIGPGSYYPVIPSWSYILQIGDFKFETNVEWRFPILGGLKGALFLDAGNVWYMKPQDLVPGGCLDAKTFFKEIALGTGVGLRYDLDFLVLRFDIGAGLHSPYDTGRSGYYNMPNFWKSLCFHFAVGYPF